MATEIEPALELLHGSSAEPETPEVPPMSFLSAVGKDFKAVFSFLGSSKGQTVIKTVEGVGEAVATAAGLGAPVQAGINLVNNWMAEIIKTEALAAAAGQQTGSGEQKSAAVVASMTAELLAFLQSQGLASTTASAKAKTISDALVDVLNALGDDTPAATPASTATSAAKPAAAATA